MDECKGCKLRGYCIHKEHTKFIDKGITYKCPCMTCLVKGICNSPCPEFNQYRETAIKLFDPYSSTKKVKK